MKTRTYLLTSRLALALLLTFSVLGVRPATAIAQNFLTVTVKAGESLATYSRIYGVSGAALMAANNLKDGNVIFPGQVLVIPVVRTTTPSLTTPFFYTAQPGDTLVAVARRFELDPGAIGKANGVAEFIAGKEYLMPAGPHIYYLKPGDTLKNVAARYGVTIDFILSGNVLPNPDLVYAGQPIFIPVIFDAQPIPLTGASVTSATQTPAPGATATLTAPAGFIRIVVQPGESLVTYVNKYKVSASAIIAANPALQANPALIFPGQVLLIPVSPATATPAPVTGGIVITVQPGESLATYVNRYKVSAAAILAANPSLQNNPALIFPGQQLVIPVSAATATPAPVTGGIVITVQPGESLVTYVNRYKVSAAAILAANPSLQNNPALIFPGQQLVIPVSASSVPTATPLPNTAGFLRITVQPGESLVTYVTRYNVTASAIIALNPSIQANPALLQPGQVLIIPVPANSTPAGPTPTATFPPAATVVPSGTPTKVDPTPITGNFIVITVRAGDSLLTYVTRYGVSGSAILALNSIKDANLIYPGQTIVIPVAVSFTPSRTTPFFYVVGAGESANTIAAKFEMGFETLTKANPGASFAVGSTVLVPAGPHVYTVKQGDELRTIAALYGTTVEFLLTGNSLPNPDRIYPGQQIFIPVQYNAVPKPF